MPEHGFSLTRIFLYKGRIVDYVLILKYMAWRKPVSWHSVRSNFFSILEDCLPFLFKGSLSWFWLFAGSFLLLSSGDSLTLWGEGASLGLVGHPSSDVVTIKMPYGIDVLHRPGLHPIFSYCVGSNWIWLYCQTWPVPLRILE